MALAAVGPAHNLVRHRRPPARRFLRLKAPATSTPRLSVVIVNYCLWEETAELVRQLRSAACTRRGDVEVVVVDNHSPTHQVAKRLRRCPEVSLRRWERNRGLCLTWQSIPHNAKAT